MMIWLVLCSTPEFLEGGLRHVSMFASLAAHFQVDDRFSGREFVCGDIPEMCCFHMVQCGWCGRRGAHGTRPRACIHNVCQRVKIIIVVTGDFPCAKDDVYDKHIVEVG